MNGVLYTVSKKPNSTAQPSGGTPITFSLKGACSVQAPIIAVKGGFNLELFTDANRLNGYRFSASGGYSAVSIGYITTFIPVRGGGSYNLTVSGASGTRYCFWYDADYNQIPTADGGRFIIDNGSVVITAPSDAGFVCFGCFYAGNYSLKESGYSDPLPANYIYIPSWSRYYWITDISYALGEWILSCKCDVLASYKSQIGSSSQYVLRAAGDSDPLLVDSLYPVRTAPTISQTTPAVDTGMVFNTSGIEGCYSVGIIGESPSSGGAFGVSYYLMSPAAMQELMNWLNTSAATSLVAGDIATALTVAVEDIAQALTKIQDYIVSCVWIPFNLPGSPAAGVTVPGVNIGFYGHTMSNTIYQSIRQEIPLSWSLTVPAHPDAASIGAWLNSSGYAQHRLYLPGVGWISLPTDDIGGGATVTVNASLSCVDGSIGYDVRAQGGNLSGAMTIGAYYGQVGVRAVMSAASTDILSAGVAAVAAAERIASGQYLGGVAGIQSAVENFLPETRVIGGASGMHVTFGPQLKYSSIVSRFWHIADRDTASHGYPLCKVKTLSTLSGYILCENAEISIPGTKQEADEVMSFLNGGFYYE